MSQAFDLYFEKRITLKGHVQKFLLYPDFWADPTKTLPINLKWKSYKFSSLNKNRISEKSGIYAFVLLPKIDNFFETKYLFYIGKTNRKLKTRFNEYLDEKEGKGKYRVKVYEMLNLYEEHLLFYFAEIPNKLDVDECERCLLDLFAPNVNVLIPEAKINPQMKYIYE